MIDMCKFEIVQLVERHFEELKDQFVKVMQSVLLERSGKQV
jgi:hypothetical protein